MNDGKTDSIRAEDAVNNPSHYNRAKIETIEVLEAYNFLDFRLLNSLKYIMRCQDKNNTIQDLNKAIWYINRYIKSLEEE